MENDREWQRSMDDDWNVEVCEWRNNGDDGGGGEKEFCQVMIKNCFGCTFIKCFSITDLIQRS